jgi:hypothetical protein
MSGPSRLVPSPKWRSVSHLPCGEYWGHPQRSKRSRGKECFPGLIGAIVANVKRCLQRGVALSVMLLALGGSLPAAAAGASHRPPIKVDVTLGTRRVVAGHPIKATVDLTNTTHKEITVNTCAGDGWLAVGLNGRVDSHPFASFLVGCPPTIRLTPGLNRFPVNVITTYDECVQPRPAGTSPSPEPVCVIADGRLSQPPLPAGRYSTALHVVGLAGLTRAANRVIVTLTAPATTPTLAPCADTPGTAPKFVTVPNVIGLSSSVAAFPLASACLNAGYANPVGTQVISQSPVAGSQVPEHSSVILTTQGSEVTVP